MSKPVTKADGLTPERRALYERIVALREAIGRVDFNIVAELRKLRGRDA